MMFCYEMTSSVDEGRAADLGCPSFSKAFDNISQNTLIDKLTKYALAKWTVRWIEKWLNLLSK